MPREASRDAARRHLRATTHALHAAVEQQLDLHLLGIRTNYVGYLRMNWPCVSIERGLAEAGVRRLLPDWDERERGPALAADLADLGVQPCRAPSYAIADDVGTLLGWSYVLEGSRLGARVILRRVEKGEDPAVRAATRFLRHGEGKPLWRSFTATLSRIDDDAGAIARAGVAAVAAFECFLAAAIAARQGTDTAITP